MATLFLLRHARASWPQPGARDFDRPLEQSGRDDAVAMGLRMANEGLFPAAAICSTAVRAKETLAEIVVGMDTSFPVTYDERLYSADATGYLDIIRNAGADEPVLIVGHNPMMEDTAAMLGLINAFDVPTRQAFVVELVGRDALMNAIAFNSSAFNAARILGPAVGGVLIASLSAGGVFLINAASYLAVIAGLVLVREAELTARPERVRERIVQSLKAGLDYVRHAPAVLLAIFLVGVVATFGMNFTVLLPVMARDVFNIGAQGFGMLMAAYGVGSVGAGLFLAFRSRLDARRSMLWGGAGVAVLGLAFALSPWLHALPLSVALLFGVGFAAITLTATANTSIQRRVPDALRGRVMAVYITVFSASVPLGSLFAGGLAKGWGAPFSLGAGAVLSGVGVLWAALRLHPAAEADSSPAA